MVMLALFVGLFSGELAGSLVCKELPSLPDPLGVAGPFAGVHRETLLVAGGANFPSKMPWDGGTKVWHKTVFALDRPNGSWKEVGELPHAIGYGVSITMEEGVVCLGGSDPNQHFSDCFCMRIDRTLEKMEVKFTSLPSLPRCCANMSGVAMGRTIFVAGGTESPTATVALRTFWALDMDDLALGWRELVPWPGEGRMLAVMGNHGGVVYLISGASLQADAQGKPLRSYLKDAYGYRPRQGWYRIADLPRPAVAAPSPAPTLAPEDKLDGFGGTTEASANGSRASILILGGDDGAQVHAAPSEHRGFPRSILAYDADRGAWSSWGELPTAQVTTPVVRWGDSFVIPSGEIRPGVRTSKVWTISP
jgi:N-acetylneuraminic acid mutarotase